MPSPRPWDAATRAAMQDAGCRRGQFALCLRHATLRDVDPGLWDDDSDVCAAVDRAVEAGWRAAALLVQSGLAEAADYHSGEAQDALIGAANVTLDALLPTTERNQP